MLKPDRKGCKRPFPNHTHHSQHIFIVLSLRDLLMTYWARINKQWDREAARRCLCQFFWQFTSCSLTPSKSTVYYVQFSETCPKNSGMYADVLIGKKTI